MAPRFFSPYSGSKHLATDLRAMGTLDSIDQDYGYDSGESIVLYFLSNAKTWRGDVARRVKAELKELVK